MAVVTCGLATAPLTLEAQAVVHVNARNPWSSNTGPGTALRPFRTITAAVAARGGPGVTILVSPGIYREQVPIGTSGEVGNPFVIRAAGHGVVVDGADALNAESDWIQFSGNVWLAPEVDWSPNQVFGDGARLTASTASPAGLPPQSFRYIAGDGLYVNLQNGNPATHHVSAGRRPYGFQVNGRSRVVIEGFTVAHQEARGIDLINSTEVTLLGNTVHDALINGIRVEGGADHLLEGNRVSENGDHGIALTSGATGCVLRRNESFRNARPGGRAANGIYLFQAPGNTLIANRLHDNQDSGVHLQSGSDNTRSLQNRSWSNGDHGFDHLYAIGTVHIGDVAYGNYRDGFSIEGFSTGTRIRNCIMVNNGVLSDEFNLFVDPNSISGFQSDYNVIWNVTAQPPVDYNFTNYATLAAFTAANGHDVHSVQADPLFVDPVAGDFQLLPPSPAIDSGDSSVPSWPGEDAVGNARVDHGATSNTGVGPIDYADRGALELAPDRGPRVIAPASVAAAEHDAVTVDIWAEDPDGDDIDQLQATGLPAGCTFTALAGHRGGVLRWTPAPGQAGNHVIDFVATNRLTGTTSTSFTVAVATPNHAPLAAIDATPTGGFELLTVTADASGTLDSDGTVVTYTFDWGDGTVVGPQDSPLATHAYPAGVWLLRVSSSDDDGATSDTTVTITVNELSGVPNQVGNPSFETNLAGWNPHSGASLSRADGGHDGSKCIEARGPSSLTIFGVNDSPNWARTIGADDRYRITAWVRSGASTGSCRLYVREYQGSTRLGTMHSQAVKLTPAWQELTMDYVARAAGSTLDLQIVDSPAKSGEVFQIDDVSIRNITRGVSGGPDPRARPLLAALSPTPMRAQAVLSFQIAVAGPVHVELFDVAGRKVRELMRESSAPPGFYQLPFRRVGGGTRLSPGAFFYRIRAREGTATGPFIVLN